MRLALLLTLAVLASLAPRPALAQSAGEKYSGRTVADVRLTIEGVTSADPALVELVEARVGEPLSMAAIRESITHFYSLGRFQDVQVEALDAPNGAVTLVFSLIPVRAVERLQFSGTLGLSAGVLRSAVEERFGARPPLARAAEVTRTLERLYQDRGYFKASIRAGSNELENRTILTFDIDAGPQAQIGTIEVVGGGGVERSQLLARLGVAPGRPYERAALQDRLSEYAQRLKRAGRLEAVASHTARLSDDGRVADLTVDVQAGPLVTVSFLGDQLPRATREALVPFQREGSVDEDLIEDASRRIRDYLRQEGYWKGDVRVDREQSGDRLTIAFTVRKGPLYRVAPEGVEITGNKQVPIDDLRPLVVLAPGQPYVSSYLDATSGAILRLYRTRGFAWAAVKTAENEPAAAGVADTAIVRPAIAIDEGPRAVVASVRVTGASAVSEAEVRRAANVAEGSPYYEPNARAARDAIELEYRDRGFASVQVAVTPTVADDRSRVDLAIDIVEGAQTLVDHVIVVGNRRTSEELIRREVVLRPGTPLGLRDVIESRRRLSQLGLFRRIDIHELEHGPPTRRDVLITVEEAPATTVSYGGGLEVSRRLRSAVTGEAEERIELAPRGFFDIGRRNLGGKNRSVSLFTRVSVRPRDAPDDPEQDGTGLGFSEYRVIGTYREPRAWNRNADLTLTGAVEQGIRSSFNFARKGVTAEVLRRVSSTIRASARYSFGTTRTFDERLSEAEQAAIDKLFPQVRLSMFSGVIARDTRDDVIEPTRGTFVTGETTVASRTLGGQVGFLKTYTQGSWYRQVTSSRRIVFATRLALGLADGFPREPDPANPEAPPIEDLPGSERFFAGGDTTVRGFALDTVGAPNTISERGFPRGGNAVIIMNAEVRVPVYKGFGAVLFTDGGNVFERVTQFDLGELRGSMGFGLRYRSPIGPIRIDLGFKLDRRELERRSVLHFSIGQAF